MGNLVTHRGGIISCISVLEYFGGESDTRHTLGVWCLVRWYFVFSVKNDMHVESAVLGTLIFLVFGTIHIEGVCVERVNLGFKSKLMRTLYERSIRTNKISS